jgi:uncharacterized protein (TIGR03492 family)
MSSASGALPADILMVSNGFGETAVAGYIARAIRSSAPQARVEHLPLVGTVAPGSWPPAVGPQQNMPSGGLVAYWNVRNLLGDLGAGLASLTVRQYRFLAQQRKRDVLIAVGDIYCLALSLITARRPTIFVATAKSDFVAPHSAFECAIARRARAVYARDERTAASLRAAGVRATYAGNIMMDGLELSGIDLHLQQGALVIAVLPGSRAGAPAAAAAQLDRLRVLAELLAARDRVVQALVSVAPSVDAQDVRQAIESHGFGLSGEGSGPGVIVSGRQANLDVGLVRGAFGDLLAAADLVLGQAGTANEQAAGLGKPVIAAAQPGEAPDNMQWYRMRQKRLLGDALLVLPGEPHAFATELVRLIDDAPRMRAMSDVGRKRMGGSGGAQAVATNALAIAAESHRA